MQFEHIAFNVQDPSAVAAWYVRHLGLRMVRRLDDRPQTHFLTDDGGAMQMEVYCNPPDAVPDYAAMDPLLLHLAFVSADPDADAVRLLAAGATRVKEDHLPDGSHLIMLRDPWGLAIQLCRRGPALP